MQMSPAALCSPRRSFLSLSLLDRVGRARVLGRRSKRGPRGPCVSLFRAAALWRREGFDGWFLIWGNEGKFGGTGRLGGGGGGEELWGFKAL